MHQLTSQAELITTCIISVQNCVLFNPIRPQINRVTRSCIQNKLIKTALKATPQRRINSFRPLCYGIKIAALGAAPQINASREAPTHTASRRATAALTIF